MVRNRQHRAEEGVNPRRFHIYLIGHLEGLEGGASEIVAQLPLLPGPLKYALLLPQSAQSDKYLPRDVSVAGF